MIIIYASRIKIRNPPIINESNCILLNLDTIALVSLQSLILQSSKIVHQTRLVGLTVMWDT